MQSGLEHEDELGLSDEHYELKAELANVLVVLARKKHLLDAGVRIGKALQGSDSAELGTSIIQLHSLLPKESGWRLLHLVHEFCERVADEVLAQRSGYERVGKALCPKGRQRGEFRHLFPPGDG